MACADSLAAPMQLLRLPVGPMLKVLPAFKSDLSICRKNFDKWWKMTWTTVKIPGKVSVHGLAAM